MSNFDKEQGDLPNFGTFDYVDHLSNQFFAEKATKSNKIKKKKTKLDTTPEKYIVLQLDVKTKHSLSLQMKKKEKKMQNEAAILWKFEWVETYLKLFKLRDQHLK